MEKTMELIGIGSQVILSTDIEAVVTGVSIRGNRYVTYECSWWDGTTHKRGPRNEVQKVRPDVGGDGAAIHQRRQMVGRKEEKDNMTQPSDVPVPANPVLVNVLICPNCEHMLSQTLRFFLAGGAIVSCPCGQVLQFNQMQRIGHAGGEKKPNPASYPEERQSQEG
jgi:hypothetical protein